MKLLVKAMIAIVVAALIIVSVTPLFWIPEDSDTVDVIIIDGQSNAAYINEPISIDMDEVNATLGVPEKDLLTFGTVHRPSMYNDPVNTMDLQEIYSDNEYKFGGLVAPLAYYCSEKSGRDTLIIDVGISAQPIANLLPGTVMGEWKMSVINAALDAVSERYSNINKVGWLWLQGESDFTTSVSTYKGSFMDLKGYYDGLGFRTCYIVEMSQSRGGNAYTAQQQLIDQYPSIKSAIKTSTWDNNEILMEGVHYSQLGRIIIAQQAVFKMNLDPFGEHDELNTVIGVIPVVLIAALLMGVVGLIVYQRYK